MIGRREFISLLGGAAAWPVVARSQQRAMPVVGMLRSTSEPSSAYLVSAFQQGLAEAGFVDGQNVVIEYRWADDQHDRLPTLAVDLVRRKVAMIIANGISVPAVKAATSTIPIIFLTGLDPVRTGLVPSIARPGGNVTGVVFTDTDLAAKQLELLHELVPKAGVVAVLSDPNQPETDLELREMQAAGRALGRQVNFVKATREQEIKAAFATITQLGAGALLVRGGPVFNNNRRQLAALAIRHALPAVFATRAYVDAGGLMSYGGSPAHAYRRAGIYAGRILKGEQPGDLPVELASKFDLVINTATAKAIDFEIPPTLLARADEVIE